MVGGDVVGGDRVCGDVVVGGAAGGVAGVGCMISCSQAGCRGSSGHLTVGTPSAHHQCAHAGWLEVAPERDQPYTDAARHERRRWALGRVAETLAAGDWGFRIQLNEDDKVRRDTTLDPAKTDVVSDFLAESAPAAWQSFSTMRLRFDEAKALQRELAELWERYSGKDEGDVYHLHLGLVHDRWCRRFGVMMLAAT